GNAGDTVDLAWWTWNQLGLCPELPGQHRSGTGRHDQPDVAHHSALQRPVFDGPDHDGDRTAVWVLPQRERTSGLQLRFHGRASIGGSKRPRHRHCDLRHGTGRRNPDANSIGDSHRDSDGNSWTDGHGDRDRDARTNGHTDRDRDAWTDGDTWTHSDPDAERNNASVEPVDTDAGAGGRQGGNRRVHHHGGWVQARDRASDRAVVEPYRHR